MFTDINNDAVILNDKLLGYLLSADNNWKCSPNLFDGINKLPISRGKILFKSELEEYKNVSPFFNQEQKLEI